MWVRVKNKVLPVCILPKAQSSHGNTKRSPNYNIFLVLLETHLGSTKNKREKVVPAKTVHHPAPPISTSFVSPLSSTGTAVCENAGILTIVVFPWYGCLCISLSHVAQHRLRLHLTHVYHQQQKDERRKEREIERPLWLFLDTKKLFAQKNCDHLFCPLVVLSLIFGGLHNNNDALRTRFKRIAAFHSCCGVIKKGKGGGGRGKTNKTRRVQQ